MEDLVVITVAAKPASVFAGYDLLQAISAAGMTFGDMNIFHYMDNDKKLFSLASATKPGDFNLDRMGAFSCIGLVLFMSCSGLSEPEKTFDLMLETAQQLADDLDGELQAGQKRIPLTEKNIEEYKNKILELCR